MDHARLRHFLAVAAAALWLLGSIPATPAWAQNEAEPVFEDLSPARHQHGVSAEIVQRLTTRHYEQPVSLDDQVSRRVFDSYIKSLDPTRRYFQAADITEFEAHEARFDDLLKAEDLGPAFEIFNRYRQRRSERLRFLIGILVDGFDGLDFQKDGSLVLVNDAWAVSATELRERWRRQLKHDVLNRLLGGTEREEVREALRRGYRLQLKRLAQTNNKDVFRFYINSFLRAIGPHNAYYPPHQSENFNIHMSLSLEGIGARLQSDGDAVKVIDLIPGGPADKAGELQPGDRIVGVGQNEDGEMVDILGMRLDEVVNLIRGRKETTVRLDIIPEASTNKEHKVIRIVRNKVDLIDQQAKSRILEVKVGDATRKIGVITLRTFYLDFAAWRAKDPNYRSSARDVKDSIEGLKQAGVEGVVIDLRGNSGGALAEAIGLAGLFIRTGPVVQVREGAGTIRVQSDGDPSIAYEGPLAVLVNHNSASASEIAAGALQDHGRALVLGAPTFGKGTVQTLTPISGGLEGQLKLTQAKFYRITGASTQRRGVIPDVELPGIFDESEVGESALDHALPWDEIDRARYTRIGERAPFLDELRQRHLQRREDEPDLKHLVARIERLRRQRAETTVSLNEKTRRARKESDELHELEIENERRVAKGEEPFDSFAELEDWNEKKAASDEPSDVDPILDEAGRILADFIDLSRAQDASAAASPEASKGS